MAAVTVAAVGVAATAYSANRQRNAARDAQRSQENAMDQQVALGREQLAFAQEQYDDWQAMFNPVLGDLRTMAYEQSDPDYTSIVADVGASFDTSQEINRRQMQRFGINPSDGAAQNSEIQYGLGRAQAMVDAKNRARSENQDQQWNRLASFYSLGAGQGTQAANMVNAAYAGVGSAYGQQAGQYGSMAMNYNNQAQQGWSDMAGWAGWGIGQYMNGQGGGGSYVRPPTPQFQPGGG